jgi:hypothetical protein
MDTMWRPTSRGAWMAVIHVALALLLQFAPSIHLLSSHRHDSSSCPHGQNRIHFEASAEAGDEAPCQVCANLLSRHLLCVSIAVRVEDATTIASRTPNLATYQATPDLLHPDDRGPPSAL